MLRQNFGLRFGFSCLFYCLAARGAAGQQFQQQAGILPVPTDYWTEGVTVVDADEDGRWDVLFVHANGWAVPGDFAATGTFPLPPILLLNTGTSGGNPVFVDASSTYLPSNLVMHGKGASVADFDGDGHEDIVLANAFGGRQHLLMKQPGTLAWVEESGRLPPLFLNCFSAGVGDLDDDGDMDIVFTDAGPQSFQAPGGQARLCINDGTGHFTEQPTWLNASNKIGAQNAKIFDIDNDFDLDVIVDGKSPQTQVYFNDGQAHFTANTTVIPSGSNSTYEVEWGDLDSDSDLDAAFMGVSGFTDGTLQNFLSDTGTLSFSLTSTTLTGVPASQDDNEFVLIDADDDGDLDVITASLSGQQEKLYYSFGAFGPGFLNCTPGGGLQPGHGLDPRHVHGGLRRRRRRRRGHRTGRERQLHRPLLPQHGPRRHAAAAHRARPGRAVDGAAGRDRIRGARASRVAPGRDLGRWSDLRDGRAPGRHGQAGRGQLELGAHAAQWRPDLPRPRRSSAVLDGARRHARELPGAGQRPQWEHIRLQCRDLRGLWQRVLRFRGIDRPGG
jgi:hypothetical protein